MANRKSNHSELKVAKAIVEAGILRLDAAIMCFTKKTKNGNVIELRIKATEILNLLEIGDKNFIKSETIKVDPELYDDLDAYIPKD